MLLVFRKALDVILADAQRTVPHEACGILLGRDDRIEQACPTANVAPDPARRFEIDPAALIAAHRAARGGGLPIIGYYHSHPAGPAQPSDIDRAMAAHDGSIWAIVGENEINFWRDGTKGFEALSYALVDS